MQFYHLLQYCVGQVGSGSQVKLEKINMGAINQNYCLVIDDRKYLVKHFVGNKWLPIKREIQYDLQTRLANVGMAVRPLHLSSKQDVYIEQWIEHSTLSAEHADDGSEPLTRHAEIDLLASTLIDVHACTISAETLSLPMQWKHYLKYMHDPERKWRNKSREYAKLWHDYEQRYQNDFTLCHNDLHISHVGFLNSGKHIIFDWEYGAFGCRFFDLIACILANQFEPENANNLIRRYIELSDYHREEVLQRVRYLQPMVIFTYQLWWQANEYQTQKRNKVTK
ncbi:phosphotransferase [Glaciecola siphonariae]|uniref:Phosphotransferase n=1 Tax=Glaciecola siphonariae TaxID=521012 RepID=A0ABV9LUY2_9ALTE